MTKHNKNWKLTVKLGLLSTPWPYFIFCTCYLYFKKKKIKTHCQQARTLPCCTLWKMKAQRDLINVYK